MLGAGLLAAFAAGPALAESQAVGGMCGPRSEPVLVVLVASPPRVREAAAGLSKAPVLVSAADTLIFADGRAVTSDLGSVSRHLNALGWATRPIEIAGAGGAGTRLPASTTRRRG